MGSPFPGATERDSGGLGHHDTGSPERKQLLTVLQASPLLCMVELKTFILLSRVAKEDPELQLCGQGEQVSRDQPTAGK